MAKKSDRLQEFLNDCIIVDTETTSKNFKEAEVIEFGAVSRDNGKWNVLYNELFKPSNGVVIPEISAVTGIVTADVADKMKFDDNNEVVKGIFSSTKELDLMIVAHNAPYDRGVLANYTGFDEYADKWLCTMRIAKRLYMDDESVTQYNLPYLRYRFELVLPRDLDHHRASADCIITATLLEYLMGVVHERGLLDDSKPYKEQIIEWSRQPVFIPKMQFGKHAGQKWEEIPTDYIKWAINNLDCLRDNNPLYDPDMEFTITQVISERLYP